MQVDSLYESALHSHILNPINLTDISHINQFTHADIHDHLRKESGVIVVRYKQTVIKL